jgi:hypothetical protein
LRVVPGGRLLEKADVMKGVVMVVSEWNQGIVPPGH